MTPSKAYWYHAYRSSIASCIAHFLSAPSELNVGPTVRRVYCCVCEANHDFLSEKSYMLNTKSGQKALLDKLLSDPAWMIEEIPPPKA